MAIENFDGLQAQQEETIDIKALFFKFVRYWYLFALTLFVAIVMAFLFNKYTSPVFEVNTTVLVKDDKSMMSAASMIGIGLSNNAQNVENEIGKLTSFSLIYRTIRELDFEMAYFIDEGLIITELYQTAPFEVVFDAAIPQAVGLKYSLTFVNKNEFELEADGELIQLYNFSTEKFEDGKLDKIKWEKTHKFGEEVSNSYNTFKIILNDNFNPEEDLESNFQFVFTDYFSLAGRFRGFEIAPINREASILEIKLKGNNTQKAVNFLNMLTYVYLQQSLEKKNQFR